MPQVKKKSFIQKNGLIAVWSMAGFVAMGYIGFLATGTGNRSANSTMVAQSPSSTTPVQQEVAALRAHVQELTSREQRLAKKLSNIEEALGPNTAAIPGQSAEMPDGSDMLGNRPEPSTDNSSRSVSVNVLPLTPNDKVFQLSGDTKAGSYGIDLASARSIDSLERHWNHLKKTNPELLKGLKAHFVDNGTADLPLYSLIAGPFERQSAAASHCKKLSTVNIDCQETSFQKGGAGNITTAGK